MSQLSLGALSDAVEAFLRRDYVMADSVVDKVENIRSLEKNIRSLENDLISFIIVVFTDIGDIIAYKHGLHFCEEVYPYRNQDKV
jgi:hypothetical protein